MPASLVTSRNWTWYGLITSLRRRNVMLSSSFCDNEFLSNVPFGCDAAWKRAASRTLGNTPAKDLLSSPAEVSAVATSRTATARGTDRRQYVWRPSRFISARILANSSSRCFRCTIRNGDKFSISRFLQIYGFPLSEISICGLWKTFGLVDFRIDSASDEV